jgi:predicted kinase
MHVIIMRGMTGAGKSTLVEKLFKTALVCSADDLFRNGAWDPKRLDEAHDQCYSRFLAGLEAKNPLIVVDNTNIKSDDYEPYVLDANDHGYSVTVFNIFCHPVTSAHRSKHWKFLKRQGPGPMWNKFNQLNREPEVHIGEVPVETVEVWTSDQPTEAEIEEAQKPRTPEVFVYRAS